MRFVGAQFDATISDGRRLALGKAAAAAKAAGVAGVHRDQTWGTDAGMKGEEPASTRGDSDFRHGCDYGVPPK